MKTSSLKEKKILRDANLNDSKFQNKLRTSSEMKSRISPPPLLISI